ncbi:hypothetical protein SEMRO_3028_G342430.1 [Seminavis robusta]|uniref:Uncharacterized protein n=1 Tax=Seminavis robusta TaxID=568900 RepID=A0A9N8F4P0_9STRA|nr:hypothetical protein SEMRO_3028_G342430.1 [Seminavis robusta]|eukprot:Sro3028_g342430.1 n/a (83) ;mRNA; f:4177-4425
MESSSAWDQDLDRIEKANRILAATKKKKRVTVKRPVSVATRKKKRAKRPVAYDKLASTESDDGSLSPAVATIMLPGINGQIA